MKEQKAVVLVESMPEADGLPAVQRQDMSVALLDVVARAASDTNVDVGKMQQLLEMQERIMAKQAEMAFNRAMQAAQDEMKPVVRDAENKHTNSRYARLETIDNAIRPIYTRHGFSLTFNSAPPAKPGAVRIICECLHSAGFKKLYELEGDLDLAGSQGKANKTGIQALGSSTSYLQRYLTKMIFNITLTNEDNDGNVSGKCISDRQAQAIEDLLFELGMNQDPALAKFLETINASSVRGMHPAVYPVAMNFLQMKRRKGQQ